MSTKTKAMLTSVVLGLALLAPMGAQALNWPNFTREAFQVAQAEGKTILIAVHADWCVTCRSQEPALEAVILEDQFKDVVVFRVDYDAQKDVMMELEIFNRSTITVYRGGKEVARAYAINRIEEIRDLFWLGL
jgi:thioredoxin 1